MALRLTRSRTSVEQRNSNLSGIGMHEELEMASAAVAVALPSVLWTPEQHQPTRLFFF